MSIDDWVIVGLFVSFAAVSILFTSWKARRRARALKSVAACLKFEFHRDDRHGLKRSCSGFRLFQIGRGRTVRNVLSGRIADLKAYLFDYEFDTGRGKSRRHRAQTVVALSSAHLAFPRFHLSRERWHHRIGEWFGLQDIDLLDQESFSKRFRLVGDDEDRVRACFTSSAIGLLETREKTSVEANLHWIIFYAPDRFAQPDEIASGLEFAASVTMALAMTPSAK
ncbi:MAG: resistance to Congo red protein [Phycisphaerales bacterium]